MGERLATAPRGASLPSVRPAPVLRCLRRAAFVNDVGRRPREVPATPSRGVAGVDRDGTERGRASRCLEFLSRAADPHCLPGAGRPVNGEVKNAVPSRCGSRRHSRFPQRRRRLRGLGPSTQRLRAHNARQRRIHAPRLRVHAPRERQRRHAGDAEAATMREPTGSRCMDASRNRHGPAEVPDVHVATPVSGTPHDVSNPRGYRSPPATATRSSTTFAY